MRKNLLVELCFQGLDYKQTLKAYDFVKSEFKEKLGETKTSYRRLEVFFSKYRLAIWLRRGDNEEEGNQVTDNLTTAVAALLTRLESTHPEIWSQVVGLLVMYGDEVLPVSLGKIKAGRSTQAGETHFDVEDTQHYWREMNRLKVLIDNEIREKELRNMLALAADKVNGNIITAPILNEIVVACEQPKLEVLDFHQNFLELPDVLVIMVLERIKLFAMEDDDGKLLNKAICVTNCDEATPSLEAALESAAQKFNSDLNISVEKRLGELKKLPYLEGLGNYYDKQRRLQKIVLTIADRVDAGESVCQVGRQASEMCKLDLTTSICQDYPEFLGHMGGEIAVKNSASDMVASAILEHYWPNWYTHRLPHTLVGALLGIADRLDDICGHYHQGELRLSQYKRVKAWFDQVISILDTVNLDLSMSRMLKFALSLYESQGLVPWKEKDLEHLLKIFTDRLYYHLIKNEFPEKVADALTLIKADNVFTTIKKAELIIDPEFAEQVEACADVCRLLDKTCAREYNYEEAAREFLEQPEEKDLFEVYMVTRQDILDELDTRRYSDILYKLARLKNPLERFISNVEIDIDDQPVKFNRLSMLAEIRYLFHLFADFSFL